MDRGETREALQEWLRSDERARQLLLELLEDPDRTAVELENQLREAGARKDTPPGVGALVTGGRVDRLVQIARAGEVNIHLDRPPDQGEWRSRLQAQLAIALNSDGSLPVVASVNGHDLGVSRSKYSGQSGRTPYLRRRVDDDLEAALESEPVILI